jgi:membrane dipeptidase
MDYGEGSASQAGFPEMPTWFQDNRHFGSIAAGLLDTGFSQDETNGIMGENWLRFYETSFVPA